MKTVFILGAGASVATGAPLMANFVKAAKALNMRRVFGESSVHIQNVLDAAYKDLKPIFAKSNVNPTNIEHLFSAIDIGHLINSFGSRAPASIEELRKSIVVFIYRTIEETVAFPVIKQAGTPPSIAVPGDYEMLSKIIREKVIRSAREGRQDVSFITFNYDACLEFGLVRRGMGVDYGLNEPFINSAEDKYQIRVPVLKLHGSINWARCPSCHKIVPTEIDPWRNVSSLQFIDTQELRLNLGSRIAGQRHHCGAALEHEPIIVPPTWNKSHSTRGLELVWQRAAREIGSAETIVIIGYSLPETDMFFKYLFALGSHSDTHLDKFVVINGPNSGAARPRFSELLGVMTSEGFEYYEFLLSGSMHIIEKTLAL